MAANAKGIRAGGAFVELFADDSKLAKGLRSAEKKMADWGKSIGAMGAKLVAFGGVGLAGAVAALGVFADMGSALVDLSDTTGIGIEALQELTFTAEQSGANAELLVNGLGRMQRTLVDAAGGSREANAALEGIGVTIDELAGLNPEQQFERIGAAIAGVENPAERTAAAMAVFGRAGARLIPTFQQLASGRLTPGRVITSDEAKAAEAFGDSLSALTGELKKVAFVVGLQLLPMGKAVVAWISDATLWVINFIDANGGLIQGLAIGAAALVVVGGALLAIGGAATVASFALGGLLTILGLVKAAVLFLLTPVGLAIVAGAALAAGIIYLLFQLDFVREGFARLIPGMDDFAYTFKQVWGGISAALSAGDLGAAAEIGWLGIQVVWQRGLNWVMVWVRAFRDDFLNVWDAITTEIAVGISTGLGRAASAFNTFLQGLPQAAQDALGGPIQFNAAGNNQILRADLARQIADRERARGAAGGADDAALARTQAELDDAIASAEIMAGIAEAERLRRAASLPGQAMQLGGQGGSVGTFSGAVAGRLSSGNTAAERTARAVEESQRILGRVLAAVEGLGFA